MEVSACGICVSVIFGTSYYKARQFYRINCTVVAT